MKAVHVSTVHEPFDGRIFHKECVSLARAGWDVALIVAGGTEERVNGVRVLGVPRASGRVRRVVVTGWHAFRRVIHEPADVYHLHDFELLPLGYLLRLTGRCVIYDVHEDVPQDVNVKEYLPATTRFLISRFSSMLEWIAAAAFQGIVIANPPVAYRFPARKTIAIRNLPWLSSFTSPTKEEYMLRARRVIYVGGLAKFRGVDIMLTLIEQLPDTELIVAGRFDSPAEEAAARMRPAWASVDFRGVVPLADIPGLINRARVGLWLPRPAKTMLGAYPTKVFEYLASGIPVVMSDFPMLREVFENSGGAIFVRPGDVGAAARAVAKLLDEPERAFEMGTRAAAHVRAEFSWEGEAARLDEFCRQVIVRR